MKRPVFLGANCIISSLGIGTTENVNGIKSYTTANTLWNNTYPISTIDWSRVTEEAEALGLGTYAKVEQLSILTIKRVLDESGISLNDNRSLLIFSTTKGNIDSLKQDFEKSQLNYTANRVANYFSAKVEPLVVSNACISGVSSVIIGSRLIKQGDYEHVVVVGIDIISEFVMTGFNSFKSLSRSICRPYDVSRDGLTLGEACAALVLTSDGSKTIGKDVVEVAGGAISNDANHISGPSRTGDGLFIAIKKAMDEAGVASDSIGFVNAHGTATLYNDEMESKALVLANLQNTPLNSLKPYFGHTLGAAGVVETIICMNQLQDGVIYGTKGFEKLGVPYELNISSEHRDIQSSHCVKTASGFGGCNAAVVLKRYEASGIKNKEKEISIEELDSIHISGNNEKPFAEFIREEYKKHCVPNMKFYKMDDLCKLGYVAAERLLKESSFDCDAADVALILSNKSSSAESDRKHQEMIDSMPIDEISPAIFVYTLTNIVAGEIAIRHKIQGETTFFVSSQKNSNFVENYSKLLLHNGIAKVVLYGWCELLADNYEAELKLMKIKNR